MENELAFFKRYSFLLSYLRVLDMSYIMLKGWNNANWFVSCYLVSNNHCLSIIMKLRVLCCMILLYFVISQHD